MSRSSSTSPRTTQALATSLAESTYDKLQQLDEQIARIKTEQLEPLETERAMVASAHEILSMTPEEAVASLNKASRRAYATGGQRAPRGANRDAILKLVQERPGITASEIADATDISRPTVHTTVSQLKRKGILEPEGSGVKLGTVAA